MDDLERLTIARPQRVCVVQGRCGGGCHRHCKIERQYRVELATLPPQDLSASTDLSTRVLNEVLLYFKDGSVFSVASYTVSGGQLHYVTGYGDKNDVSVDELDLQKTIQANAARGVAFTLTPASPAAGSSPSPLGPAPAPPGPITPPKQ